MLNQKIEKLLEKVGNNTHIENQQINIHINNYGKENLDYITEGYISKLLKIPYGAVPKLIKHIHFNPEHPENHNIKITNKKLPYASVFKDDKFILIIPIIVYFLLYPTFFYPQMGRQTRENLYLYQ